MKNGTERFIKEKTLWLFKKIYFFQQPKRRATARVSRTNYLKYKNQAYHLAIDRINYFNDIYGFKFNKISIKNQKTRWGSCSKKGNLNFNYRITLLPPSLSDYIIVHEICHLEEFNHSKKFWNLVEKTIPDYKKLRSELKQRKT